MDIKAIVKKALPVIFANEGGYASVNKNDNGAVSIGRVQWHGNRALALLKKIIKADKTNAAAILGPVLYQEIVSATDWYHRTVDAVEAMRIGKLISTAKGKAFQDDQAAADVEAYVQNGVKLGIEDPATLIYYADVENQGGAGASRRVGKAAVTTAGSAAKVTLDIYHACALKDSVMGKYKARRDKVYGLLKNPYTEPTETIKQGSRGEAVKWVQWELVWAGSDVAIDGNFGPKTDKAVREYQQSCKLVVDGKVGPATRKTLKAD